MLVEIVLKTKQKVCYNEVESVKASNGVLNITRKNELIGIPLEGIECYIRKY